MRILYTQRRKFIALQVFVEADDTCGNVSRIAELRVRNHRVFACCCCSCCTDTVVSRNGRQCRQMLNVCGQGGSDRLLLRTCYAGGRG